jgi:CNP1-like family
MKVRIMASWKQWAAALSTVFAVGSALAAAECNTRKYYECYEYEESEDEKKVWQEEKVTPPAAPDMDKLIPFEVSVANANRFLVDPASVSVGKDGVVRFTVVIESSGGARTVNYEGLRCKTRERRLYAFGQPDGSWIESKGSSWILMQKQQHKMVNAYPAVLAYEYFCLDMEPPPSAEVAVERLRTGPAATSAR